MKLRSLILVSALAALTAFGAGDGSVYTGNSVSAMAVPTTAYTLIAVPFKTLNAAADTVRVSDLVKTDGLAAGTRIYYYADSTYYSWALTDGAWVPSATTKRIDGKDVTWTAPSADFGIPCGATLWLESSAASVLLYGAEPSSALVPSLTARAVQFLSNPNPADRTLTETEGVDGDQIIVPAASADAAQTTYTFKTGKGWCRYTTEQKTLGTKTITTKVYSPVEMTIPGGRGVWYVSKGGSVPTIEW